MPGGPRRIITLEPKPSTLVARYLFPTERYRGEWKRHWIHLGVPLLIGIAATFGWVTSPASSRAGMRATAMTVVVVIWLAVIGWVAWKVVDWYFDRFILTNKRVMVVNGIITRESR